MKVINCKRSLGHVRLRMRAETKSYLLVESVELLRHKLNGGQKPLDRWWPHFFQLA